MTADVQTPEGPDAFIAQAAEFPDPFRLIVRDHCGSTNDDLRKLAEAGAAEGLVVLAMNQDAGRGRRGASWFCSAESSLAFSILLRPSAAKPLWPRLALAAGAAVAEAIEEFGIPCGIKWPNDIWIGRHKVAGILVEAGPDTAIVGIGLNVNTRNFPPEIADIATSLCQHSNAPISRAEVLAAIIRRFAIRRNQIDTDFAALLNSIRNRCVLSGQHVSLVTAKGRREGLITGIAEGGELILQCSTGVELILQADEVRLMT